MMTVSASAPAQTPLNDLGTGTHLGFQGGLYPSGANTPPAGHLAAAMIAAGLVTPLPNPSVPGSPGLIGVLSIGMSNTSQEWANFERRADTDVHRNARVVIVNGAVGGMSAEVIDDPAASYWTIVMQRLAGLGLSASQVQVVWLKEANQNPVAQFPQHADTLKSQLRTIVQIIKDKFPNVRLCYLSSRIYHGYASGEPYAYHTGFSVKWLIEDQINGEPGLNHDPASGPVEAPVLLWGPYLWAEGLNPRSDGLTWQLGDFESDRTHPSESGEQKVGAILKSFFDNEPTAQHWWGTRDGWKLVSLPCSADATVSEGSPDANLGSLPTLTCFAGNPSTQYYLKFDMSGVSRPAAFVKLGLRASTSPTASAGGSVRLVPDSGWSELGITWNTAPPATLVAGSLQPSSRDGTSSCDITPTVNASIGSFLSLQVSGTQSATFVARSREFGDPPRLVFTIAQPLPGDLDGDGQVTTADLVLLLGMFGTNVTPNTFSDLNGDGWVDTGDLVLLLGQFGA